ARDRRPPAERLRPQQDDLPLGQLPQLSEDRARDLPLGRPPFEHDSLQLLLGTEELGVDAGEDEPVVARQALGGGRGYLGRGRKQCIEPREQARALWFSERVAEPLGGEEGG